MATIVAAAGGGNWSATTTWVGGAVPTASDDVQLIASSGAVTIDVAAACRSLDCSSYTNILTHGAVTLTIGDGTAGLGSSALWFSSTMTYTLANTATSAVTFVSTSSTAQTINTGNKTLGNVTYNAASNGSWIFTSANNANIVNLTAGTLNTNSQTCIWLYFVSTSGSTRAITFGSSSITLNGADAGGTSWNVNNANITSSIASSNIILGGKITPGVTLGTVTLTGNLTTNTAMTCINLVRIGTATRTDSMTVSLNGSLIVTGTVTLTGNSVLNRLLVQSNTLGSPRAIAAANTTLSNVDFMDMTGSGAATWTGTSIGDCGGNSVITFDSPATQTWSGTAGGNWSANAWSGRVPLPQDNVVINTVFSASQTVTADMPRLGKSITWTGTTGSPAWSSSITTTIFGSLTLVSSMSVGTANIVFGGRGAVYTITTVGKNFPASLSFLAPTGSYVLQDALFCSSSTLSITAGGFDANNFNISANLVIISGTNTRSVSMGTGIWTLGSAAATTVWSAGTTTGLTFSGSAATILIGSVSANTRTFAGGGLTYGTLTYIVSGSTGRLIISGANTFGAINFSDTTNARTLTLPSSATTTITSAFNVQGSAGKLMTVNAATGGTAATVSAASGIITCNYLAIQDSTAAGGATWYAGANSTDISGNTGWLFTNPPSTQGRFFTFFD